MRLPLSYKNLFRLHRKLFMLRRPRSLARKSYCVTLTPGKKKPTFSLRVIGNRSPVIGTVFAIGVFALAAWLSAKE